MSLYMVGQVTNSIVVLLIQVFVLLAMNANDLYTTTIVYFMAVVAIIFSILMTFIFVVLRHPIVKDMLEKKQKTDELKKSQDKNTLRESVKMQEAITWA
jgi:Na+/melibiose symporter-like transporter